MKRALILIASVAMIALVATPCFGQDMYQHELEKMYETDQGHRSRIDSLRKIHGPDSDEVRKTWDIQREIDEKNIARLEAIIEEIGWPKISDVGKRASTAAFLILQHAELAMQQKYLPLVREAWSVEEVSGQHMALLEDRILMREEKPQIYGTQLVYDENGELKLYPIADEANVDKRRAEMGMWPLAEYLQLQGIEYKPPNK